MMDQSLTPSLNELLEHYVEVSWQRLHTTLPGKIQSYDPARQVADIIPMVPRVVRARLTRERKLEQLPVLADVPVQHAMGGRYFVHVPLEPGDYVMVHVTETDMNEYLRTGEAVDPGITSRFRLSSSYAVPGVPPELRRIQDVLPNAIVIGRDGGGPKVVIDAGLVRLGSVAASQFVALSNLVDAQLNALKSAIAAAVVVPNDGGASFKATLLSALSAWPASVAATKAVAE